MTVSDGGKPFAVDIDPTTSGAIALKKGLDIMMEQIRGLEFDRIEHRHAAKAGPVHLRLLNWLPSEPDRPVGEAPCFQTRVKTT